MIKHISFDLWLTLIKSHPKFKEQRAVYFKSEFNPHNLSVNQIMDVVQQTDKACDRLNELNGLKVPTDIMYRRILLQLGIAPRIITSDVLATIKSKVRDIFMNLPPLLLNETILPMLYYLKSKGYGLNIGSNTGFIEGGTIVETLNNMNIGEYFDFCIFSDEIGASKPSYRFFDKVYANISLDKKEILHVGDNYKADYEGAMKFGFSALFINNQSHTINDIKRHLQEND